MEPSLRVASLSEDVYRFRSNYVRCSYFLGTWVVGRRSLLSLRGTANSLYLSYHTERGPRWPSTRGSLPFTEEGAYEAGRCRSYAFRHEEALFLFHHHRARYVLGSPLSAWQAHPLPTGDLKRCIYGRRRTRERPLQKIKRNYFVSCRPGLEGILTI